MSRKDKNGGSGGAGRRCSRSGAVHQGVVGSLPLELLWPLVPAVDMSACTSGLGSTPRGRPACSYCGGPCPSSDASSSLPAFSRSRNHLWKSFSRAQSLVRATALEAATEGWVRHLLEIEGIALGFGPHLYFTGRETVPEKDRVLPQGSVAELFFV